jgi:hypothetical protein
MGLANRVESDLRARPLGGREEGTCMNRTAWVFLALVLLGGVVYWSYREGVFDDWLGRREAPDTTGLDKLPVAGADGLVSEVPGLQDRLKAAREGRTARPLAALLVDFTRKNIQMMEALLEVAESGCGCGACLRDAEAALAARKDEVYRLGSEVSAAAGGLPAADREAEAGRAAGELAADMRVFEGRMKAGLEGLRIFKQRCPKEAAVLNQRLQDLQRNMREALGR